MSSKIQSIVAAVGFFLIPLVVFGWTSFPIVAGYTLHLFMVFFLVSMAMAFMKSERIKFFKTMLHVATVMLLVGSTGWFFSPFFFFLTKPCK